MADAKTNPAQSAEQYAEAVSVRVAGMTHQRLGEFQKAMSCFSIAKEIFSSIGNPTQVAWTLQNEGLVLDLINRQDDALARFTEAEAIFRQNNEIRGWPLMYRRRGDILRRLGRMDQALEQYEGALTDYRPINEINGIINTLSSRAEVHLQRQANDLAAKDLAEAYGLLRQNPRRPSEFDFLLYARLARCSAASGQREQARSHAEAARKIVGELGLDQDRSNPDVAASLRLLTDLKLGP